LEVKNEWRYTSTPLIYSNGVLKDSLYLIEKFWLPKGTDIYFIKPVYVTRLKTVYFPMCEQ